MNPMTREELEQKIQEETELIAKLRDSIPMEQTFSTLLKVMDLNRAEERLNSLRSQMKAFT